MSQILAIVSLILISAVALAQTPSPQPTRSGASNPDIGMNLLMLYRNSNRGNDSSVEERNGASIDEVELQFTSDVDAYWRLVGTLAIHQEYNAGPPPTRENVVEAEEAFTESLALPYVTLKIGKFKAAMGKHNQLHAHAYPFIDAPLMNKTLLGGEGLNDAGVSLAYLIPVSWFSELTLQALSGQGEGLDYYAGTSANDSVSLAHLKNLWDLSDDLTFEFGASGATGQNSFAATTNLFGIDMTLKWRPGGSQERAVVWSTEALKREFDQTAAQERDGGVASWIQYQVSKRWWAQVRGEYLQAQQQDPASTSPLPELQRKQSLLVGYVPTEFSAVRVQYDHLYDGAIEDEQRVLVQFNYSIGAHPAHAY